MNNAMGNLDKRIIFFDFDGVIADTAMLSYDVYKTIWHPVSFKEYTRRFDGNINEGVARDRILESGRKPEEYHDIFAERILEQSLFPGVGRAIREIYDKHKLLVIISSSRTANIEAYLEHHNLRSCFSAILGNDVHHKKNTKMGMVLKEYDANPANAVIVTDTLGDIREADLISVGSIAVAWGFHDKENLLKGNPRAFIETPENLPEAIDSYFETRP